MSLVKNINIYSERLRRYRIKPKKVGLDLTLTIILDGDARYCTSCVPYEVRYDWGQVLADLPFRVNSYNDGPKSNWDDCDQHGKNSNVMSSIVVKFWLAAEDDKPSKILSESEALRAITNRAVENKDQPWDEQLTLEEIFNARIQAVMDAAQEQLEASNIAKQANHLITHATHTAREQAKINTGFDAKLAALKAEFEAEQESCLAAYIKDELAPECEEDETDWHPRAIELAREKADECLAPAIRSIFGRDGTCDKVKMADVFPEAVVEETAIA